MSTALIPACVESAVEEGRPPIFIPAIGAELCTLVDLARIGVFGDFLLTAGFAFDAGFAAALCFALGDRACLDAVGFFFVRAPIFMPMGICIFDVSPGACC